MFFTAVFISASAKLYHLAQLDFGDHVQIVLICDTFRNPTLNNALIIHIIFLNMDVFFSFLQPDFLSCIFLTSG